MFIGLNYKHFLLNKNNTFVIIKNNLRSGFMVEKYLVINGGSSSLKFSLYQVEDGKEKNLVNGLIERIGYEGSGYILKINGEKITGEVEIPNHTVAVEVMLEKLKEHNLISSIDEIKGVGHRVLHGGEFYDKSVLITEDSLENIKSLEHYGPLHMPGEISGIESMMEKLPGVPQVATFDTAFHQTIPNFNYMYAIPIDYYEKEKIRKYGFHGTSHQYITEVMQDKLNKKDVNLIVCHIGSGASICAVKDGLSFDTTMGYDPNSGLMMGTRSAELPFSVTLEMKQSRNLSDKDIENILNKESGLKGISGKNDCRDVDQLIDEGNKNAKLAMEMFKLSVIRFISSYYTEIIANINKNRKENEPRKEIDGIIFTAGVGENNIRFREDIINYIADTFNIKINKQANENIASYKSVQEGIITTSASRFPVYVIPTDEEYMILKDAIEIAKEYKETKKYKLENSEK